MPEAPPETVAGWLQGHWGIGTRLHWVRDVTFDEDRHQLRVGAGPQVMAILRNTIIAALRLAGWDSIAAGLRHHPRTPRTHHKPACQPHENHDFAETLH